MLRFLNLKTLAVLVLGLALVVGIGSAGALTVGDAADVYMVEGTFDTGAIMINDPDTTIGGDGVVTATYTTENSYEKAKASPDNWVTPADTIECTTAAQAITCVFPPEVVSDTDTISIIAAGKK